MTTYILGKNPKTKKELKELVASGAKLQTYTESPFASNTESGPGTVYVSMPKYPAPHKAYAQCELDKDGFIVKVK